MLIETRVLRPMRGVSAETLDFSDPYIEFLKYDGVRAFVKDGVVLSKKMLPIPSLFVQRMFGHLHGADGELVVGAPFAEHEEDNVFLRTTGPVRRKSDEPFDVFLIVFDNWALAGQPLVERLASLAQFAQHPRVSVADHYHVTSQGQHDEMLRWATSSGFEGLILRRPDSLYKFGQATLREGSFLKVKPFADSEAVIVELIEARANNNPKVVREDGLSRRSSTKANKTAKGTVGALLLKDIYSGVTFTAGFGPGFTKDKLQEIWDNSSAYLDKIVLYRYQKYGTANKPRSAKVHGFRSKDDLPGI